MDRVAIDSADTSLEDLAARAERGETIVLTRGGLPVADLVPHRRRGGIDLEAGRRYLKSIGVEDPFPRIADNFDDPLPENFLITPETDDGRPT